MRLIFVAVALLLVGGCSAEGPFGLEMGMKKSELVSLIAEEFAPHNYKLTSVPRPHSAFESYSVVIGPQSGLCRVLALGWAFSADASGRELRAKFVEIEKQLKQGYGRHQLNDWQAEWTEEEGSNMKNHVQRIELRVAGSDTSTGRLVLNYYFSNYGACKGGEAEVL